MILYQGLLASPASWARVGRAYTQEFCRRGLAVSAVVTRGFGYDENFSISTRVDSISAAEARQLVAADDPGSEDSASEDSASEDSPHLDSGHVLGIGFLHPPHLERLLGKPRLNLFVWEADRIPPQFLAPLIEFPDEVVVPSDFTRQSLLREGVPESQVRTVPYGFDHELLEILPLSPYEPHETRPLRFLCCASPHWRKGIRELLQAYRRSFDGNDAVSLTIKSSYDPATSRRSFPFEIPGWRTLLAECGFDEGDAPAVDLRLQVLTDDDTHELYRQHDVVVAPSWGESFGLVCLEAAAAARPVITSNWSAPPEFLPAGADLLPVRLQPAHAQALYLPVEGAQVALPDVSALAERLRWHFDNRQASCQVGSALREHVRALSWRSSSDQLLSPYLP